MEAVSRQCSSCEDIQKHLLCVWDIFSVWPIGDQYWHLVTRLRSVDVASDETRTALKWYCDILTEYVREGFVVCDLQVPDLVRHLDDMNDLRPFVSPDYLSMLLSHISPLA